MLKHKKTDLICLCAVLLAVALTVLLINGERFGLQTATSSPAYVSRLFDQSVVHTVDVVVEPEDWEQLLANPMEKKYIPCTVVIDGEAFRNIGIRTKGHNSLGQTVKYGSQRFSLKIEFDHYQKGYTYYGLDKLSLHASFQDNAYLKEYMTFDMMAHMGVPAPLASFSYLTVNGEDRGLFVAIEEVEHAFAKRNFGADRGNLYKPEYRRLEEENNDVALIYTDDDFDSYDGIFRKAVFQVTDSDKRRLIRSLKQLSTGENLEEVLEIDGLMRYFVVQSFVVNLDGYLGSTGHNYYLYEKDGVLSMLPWDYNLAYATYALGIESPINDSTLFVNYPIDTPAPLEVMSRRPMFFIPMLEADNLDLYHAHYAMFIETYFNSGYFSRKVDETIRLISPYVEKDPTKFCSYTDFLLAADTFEQFCLLRAESVKGQLEGTIPSTIRGQSMDQSSFVDASSVWIPDLGNLGDMRKLADKRLREYEKEKER